MTSYFIINALLLLFLIITAISVAVVRDLLFAIVMLGIFSLLMAVLYLVMGAADVAITEAAVGAGISTILLLCALTLTGREERLRKSHNIAPLLVIIAMGGALFYASLDFPAFGNPDAPIHKHVAPYYLEKTAEEIHMPNVVTAVLASYRGYDTLGETTVIFTAAMAVLVLLNGKRKKRA